MGRPKFNQLEMVHYLYLQTQFGEDRCTQFLVIVVTNPPTHTPTHPPTDRTDYTAPQLARSVINSSVFVLYYNFFYCQFYLKLCCFIVITVLIFLLFLLNVGFHTLTSNVAEARYGLAARTKQK